MMGSESDKIGGPPLSNAMGNETDRIGGSLPLQAPYGLANKFGGQKQCGGGPTSLEAHYCYGLRMMRPTSLEAGDDGE
jgi:hypothetical protein